MKICYFFWFKREIWLLIALAQTAAEIIHNVMKKVIELSVEGAKVIDICIEGDKLIEQGTASVYNKPIKGVRFNKGTR